MTMKEVTRRLRDEGVEAQPHQIARAVLVRAVPACSYDGAGNRIFNERHVVALREYFSTPHPRGRKAS